MSATGRGAPAQSGRVALEPLRAEPSPRVTHLTYAVREVEPGRSATSESVLDTFEVVLDGVIGDRRELGIVAQQGQRAARHAT